MIVIKSKWKFRWPHTKETFLMELHILHVLSKIEELDIV